MRKGTLVAILALVAAAAIFYSTRSEDTYEDLPGSYRLVCVATGERFVIDRDDLAVVPAKNPKTGKYTLLPFSKNDEGKLVVSDRYRGLLRDRFKDTNKHVDPVSLELIGEQGG